MESTKRFQLVLYELWDRTHEYTPEEDGRRLVEEVLAAVSAMTDAQVGSALGGHAARAARPHCASSLWDCAALGPPRAPDERRGRPGVARTSASSMSVEGRSDDELPGEPRSRAAASALAVSNTLRAALDRAHEPGSGRRSAAVSPLPSNISTRSALGDALHGRDLSSRNKITRPDAPPGRRGAWLWKLAEPVRRPAGALLARLKGLKNAAAGRSVPAQSVSVLPLSGAASC